MVGPPGPGKLILYTGLDVLYIKDVYISENVNEHGKMTVRFITKAGTESIDAVRQQGTEAKLVTVEGENDFVVFVQRCVCFGKMNT